MNDYLPATARWIKVLVLDLLLATAGAVLDVGGFASFPRWVWITLFVLAVVIGPFWAYHKQRLKMDELRVQLGMPRLEDQKTFFDEPWYPTARLVVLSCVALLGVLLLGIWIGRDYLRAPETRWELHIGKSRPRSSKGAE